MVYPIKLPLMGFLKSLLNILLRVRFVSLFYFFRCLEN